MATGLKEKVGEEVGCEDEICLFGFLLLYSLLYVCLVNVNFMSESEPIAWTHKKPVISS